MRYFTFALSFCFLMLPGTKGLAQYCYYQIPVNIPVLLSASFAELRDNHFHSGIDIKTEGKEGIPIYAAADGYISRISISPGGYGNAIYIDHPNGTTTVYGHLQRFAPELQSYATRMRLKKHSSRLDLSLACYLFPVKKGELIAWSGNSGSSAAPHLHFEIRETRTQDPLNPLTLGIPVEDHTAPRIYAVMAVPLTNHAKVNGSHNAQIFQTIRTSKGYRLNTPKGIHTSGQVGFALQTNDFFDNTRNRCGINTLKMKVDNRPVFFFELNRFSFRNSRYINSHFYYPEYADTGRRFIKTWLDPGNRMPIYQVFGNDSVLQTAGKHRIQIEVSDTYENSSKVEFIIQQLEAPEQMTEKNRLSFNQTHILRCQDAEVTIPQGALYRNREIELQKKTSPVSSFSGLYSLTGGPTPFHIPAQIKLFTPIPAGIKREKLYLARYDENRSETEYCGGKWRLDTLVAHLNTPGNYIILADTVAPQIALINRPQKRNPQLIFRIEDKETGIASYALYLNHFWVPTDYDAKTQCLTYTFDKHSFPLERLYHIRLEVKDNCLNTRVREFNYR